jgi:hypothetical protein
MDKKEKVMSQYKLRNGDIIELRSIGVGATAADVIWINKTNMKGDKVIVSRLVGLSDIYEVSFEQLNDTLLKISFVDTVVFKGSRIDTTINLNKRITPNT